MKFFLKDAINANPVKSSTRSHVLAISFQVPLHQINDKESQSRIYLIFQDKILFREKVLAKLKLSTQSDFDPGVETDEQLWSLIKKLVQQITKHYDQ